MDDSLTESESESDILQMKMKCKLSAPDLPSREMKQDCPLVRCRSAQGNLPGAEDDSATEAESDTEILHCVAEIGRKRPRDHRSGEDTPPRPVVSPLVSPARPRIATMPSIIGSAQLPAQEGGPSIPGSRSSYPPARIPSESLPPVVRDFIHMFSGDESYPADFPESLRV